LATKLITSITALGDKTTPSEKIHVAPRNETTRSRTLDQRVNLAPRIAAGAFTLSILSSIYFGVVAKRDSLPIDTGGFVFVAGLFVGALAIERRQPTPPPPANSPHARSPRSNVVVLVHRTKRGRRWM
jgi:xanthine/CO dehydrogenase XdhC/CoxF family maturation factor